MAAIASQAMSPSVSRYIRTNPNGQKNINNFNRDIDKEFRAEQKATPGFYTNWRVQQDVLANQDLERRSRVNDLVDPKPKVEAAPAAALSPANTDPQSVRGTTATRESAEQEARKKRRGSRSLFSSGLGSAKTSRTLLGG